MSEYPVDQSLEPRHTSRAARQRAYLDAQGMEYGSELRAMGKVRTVNGAPHLLYSDQWRPAAYHHELRAELVAAAPPERYVHPPERGIGDNDVTSFWEPHRTWGFATRKDRPKVLFEWLPIIERGMDWPRPMMHNDRIVIDMDNDPVLDWPMPSCFSSQVEGGRMEAIIRESGNRITKRDIRARMPAKTFRKNGDETPSVSEHALAMRRTRFREEAGLLSWNPGEGSLGLKKALIQCIPADFMDQILVTNDTSCFRDLNAGELAFIRSVNKGERPDRAGARGLPKDVRERLAAKKGLKRQSFKPVNESAWPYLDRIKDDKLARSRAKAKLGLPQTEPHGYAQAFEELNPMVDVPTEEDHTGIRMNPATQRVQSARCRKKKRQRDEEIGTPNAGNIHTKRQRNSTVLENHVFRSPSVEFTDFPMDPDYYHGTEGYAQELASQTEQFPLAISPQAPMPSKRRYAQDMFLGGDMGWVDETFYDHF